VIVNVRYFAKRCSCIIILLIAAGYGLISGETAAYAEDKAVFKGKVTDVQGRPAEGSMVFVYASPDVRRSADFISPPTGRDGVFKLSLPPGKYWAVARLKKVEGFGPLMPGDRHSGEPKEIELAPDSEVEMQFTVTDLREAVIMRTKDREGPARLSGRIIDEQGAPVKGVYAIASKNEKPVGIPNYISAWVDNDGHFTLYIPRGSYYIGSAVTFPPGDDVVMDKKITVDAERMDADILRISVKSNKK
jgi:hypothetical protein